MKQNLSKRRVVSDFKGLMQVPAAERERIRRPAHAPASCLLPPTYFPEEPKNSLLGPPAVVTFELHAGLVAVGHVVGKHIVLATKCTDENGQLFWTL